MHTRRWLRGLDAFHAALWLAAGWSAIAAAITAVLASITTLSEPALVLGVMLFGFVASWVVCEHADAAAPADPAYVNRP